MKSGRSRTRHNIRTTVVLAVCLQPLEGAKAICNPQTLQGGRWRAKKPRVTVVTANIIGSTRYNRPDRRRVDCLLHAAFSRSPAQATLPSPLLRRYGLQMTGIRPAPLYELCFNPRKSTSTRVRTF